MPARRQLAQLARRHEAGAADPIGHHEKLAPETESFQNRRGGRVAAHVAVVECQHDDRPPIAAIGRRRAPVIAGAAAGAQRCHRNGIRRQISDVLLEEPAAQHVLAIGRRHRAIPALAGVDAVIQDDGEHHAADPRRAECTSASTKWLSPTWLNSRLAAPDLVYVRNCPLSA